MTAPREFQDTIPQTITLFSDSVFSSTRVHYLFCDIYDNLHLSEEETVIRRKGQLFAIMFSVGTYVSIPAFSVDALSHSRGTVGIHSAAEPNTVQSSLKGRFSDTFAVTAWFIWAASCSTVAESVTCSTEPIFYLWLLNHTVSMLFILCSAISPCIITLSSCTKYAHTLQSA